MTAIRRITTATGTGLEGGSGGTVTSANGYTYHTFTSSGTFTG